MSDLVHPLYTDIQPPRQFTYPFCYEPHPLCIAAAKEAQRYIEESGVWKDEKGPGKMFGVLCVSEKGKVKSEKLEGKREHIGFLAAYSGLLADGGKGDIGS